MGHTFWEKNKWLILLALAVFAIWILAIKLILSNDPFREALLDETSRCIDESGVVERSGLSREEIREGIVRDDTEEMYATMRTLGCLPE